MYSVLFVDDEPDLLDITKLFLEASGKFHVDTCGSAADALALPGLAAYDAVITDFQMPVMNGIEFLKEIRQKFGDLPVLIFTGHSREDIVIEALNSGADFYVQKGGDPEAQYTELGYKTLQAILRRRAEQSVDSYTRIFATIPVGLLLLNADLEIRQASEVIARMVLREPADIIGEQAGAGLGCIHSREVPEGCGHSRYCPDCPLRNGVRKVLANDISVRDAIIPLTLLIGGKPTDRLLRVNAGPVILKNARYVIVAIDDVTSIQAGLAGSA
ncbi:response regulator [Methanoregula sp. UBA64]|uniref:response regulator n=1 Tax=Methanoregula sp. UBA64 TaxID=1915554 RepID=UPI0025D33197|nr:response regulator [Methanoregula sp. UBA64]